MGAPTGFEHGIPGLVIQRPNQYATTRQKVPETRCLLDGRVYENQRERKGLHFLFLESTQCNKKLLTLIRNKLFKF